MFFRISNGAASTSDLAQMSVADIDRCGLGYEVVDEVVRLLREGWPVVQQEAEYSIKFAAD
ncbi:hypothetical protein WN982_20725 [Paraburkholderia sp. IMGN_8]|uniref:hypothetical protein n=1 Tax=Paraburkholderia sp. IMGN_8 TaxID=3136564 RepID=UPI003101873E